MPADDMRGIRYFLLIISILIAGTFALLAYNRTHRVEAPTKVPNGYVEVEIEEATMDAVGGVMYLAERDTDRVLPIHIGLEQARVISMLIHKSAFERPMMHDLLKEVLKDAKVKLDYVSIDRLDNNVYYATVVLNNGRLDARPSDGVILALANGIPIYVHGELMRSGDAMEHPRVSPHGGIAV